MDLELSAEVIVAVALLSIAQLAVMIWGLVDLFKRPIEQVRWANKWIWAAIIVLVNTFIGTIAYFVFGRIPAVVDEVTGVSGVDPNRTQNAVDSLYGGSDR